MKKHIISIFALTLLTSCLNKDPIELRSQEHINVNPKDILVLSQGTKSLVQLDSNGLYKDTLFVAPVGSTLRSLTWDQTNQRVLIGYTYSTTTKIISVAPLTKTISDFSVNAFITTALTATIPTHNGYVFSSTPTSLRKLNPQGVHIVEPGFPLASGLPGTVVQLSAMPNDHFLLCTTASPYLKIFNSSAQTILTASGITPPTGTTTLTGCAALNNGRIVLSWSGTSDTVAVYDPSNFSTPLHTYTDTSILGSPKWIQKTSTGNILILDTVFNLLLELDPNMEFVRTIGEGFFSGPTQFILL